MPNFETQLSYAMYISCATSKNCVF